MGLAGDSPTTPGLRLDHVVLEYTIGAVTCAFS